MGNFEKLIRSWIFKSIFGPNKFSKLMGYFADIRIPEFILNRFLKFYISFYEIDMNLFEHKQYNTFNEFFTRKLKKGIRSFEGELLSPAESVLSEYGLVDNKIILSIKGMKCKMEKLCGKKELMNFSSFGLFYLSPSDYHRVHAPFDMLVSSVEYISGDLYSVQPANVNSIDNLFCENKRVVIYGESVFGKFALVLVGALVVGKILLNFIEIDLDSSKGLNNLNIKIDKGDELGMFELGSTVIMFLENNIMEKITISKGKHILVGANLLN